MKKPDDESGFFVVVQIQELDIKKESLMLPFFVQSFDDYQHLVLWNDDAGSPAPL